MTQFKSIWLVLNLRFSWDILGLQIYHTTW